MAATAVKSRQVLDGTITSADIANNAIITALIASGAVTFSKLAIYATNPCLEDDGSGNMRVQVDNLSGTPPIALGGTITRTASGLAINSVPTTAMTGLITQGNLYAGQGLATGRPAVVSVGTNGQVLVVDSSSATTHLRWQDDMPGFKNKIINGNFDIWQRNVTFTPGASASYTADRWQNAAGTSGALTVTRQAFTVGQTDVPGEPQYFMQHAQTTGGSTVPFISQRIEGVRTCAGQTVTLSFYAKASTSITLTAKIVQGFGTGGSADVSTTAVAATVSSSTFTKFTATVAIPSISGKTVATDGTDHLRVTFELPTSQIVTVGLSQVQLEVSNVATIFDVRSRAIEMLMCQRFYFKTYPYDVVPGTATANGLIQGVSSGTLTNLPCQLPVIMRVSPTVTIYSFSGVSGKITQNGGAEITAFADTFCDRGGTISNLANAVDVTKYFCYVTCEAEL